MCISKWVCADVELFGNVKAMQSWVTPEPLYLAAFGSHIESNGLCVCVCACAHVCERGHLFVYLYVRVCHCILVRT